MAEGGNTTLLTYVREKEEAREEVKRVEQELAATKSKLYDALQKIDELKDKVRVYRYNGRFQRHGRYIGSELTDEV